MPCRSTMVRSPNPTWKRTAPRPLQWQARGKPVHSPGVCAQEVGEAPKFGCLFEVRVRVIRGQPCRCAPRAYRGSHDPDLRSILVLQTGGAIRGLLSQIRYAPYQSRTKTIFASTSRIFEFCDVNFHNGFLGRHSSKAAIFERSHEV